MDVLTGHNWKVMHADCRAAFASLPAKSVHCIVSSPPYWGGVRDYQIPPVKWADGWEGCYGNEPSIDGYVAHTIEVFAALSHALRDDGVIWWNIGDCYSSGGRTSFGPGTNKGQPKDGKRVTDNTVKDGNKCLVPFRIAIALQEAGWIVRQDGIWSKPGPMPESIGGWEWRRCRRKVGRQPAYSGGLSSWDMGEHTHGPTSGEYRGQDKTIPVYEECIGCDKCRETDGLVLRRGTWRSTTSHEYLFQIVRAERYFCDPIGGQEPTTGGAHPRGSGNNPKSQNGRATAGKQNASMSAALAGNQTMETRNVRSVWQMSAESYPGAHFATFPTKLPHRCIKAATSAGGCCATCGSQYAPIVRREQFATRPAIESKVWREDEKTAADGKRSTTSPNRDPHRKIVRVTCEGYRPTCVCPVGEPARPVVADPFTGSGTVLQVAINTGRQFVGSEIAAHYMPLIQERAATPWAPKDSSKPKVKRRKKHARERSLFT